MVYFPIFLLVYAGMDAMVYRTPHSLSTRWSLRIPEPKWWKVLWHRRSAFWEGKFTVYSKWGVALLGGGFQLFHFSPLPGEMIQFGLIFFKWVETTNESWVIVFLLMSFAPYPNFNVGEIPFLAFSDIFGSLRSVCPMFFPVLCAFNLFRKRSTCIPRDPSTLPQDDEQRGVLHHLRKAGRIYIGSMKLFSEGDWIPIGVYN